MSIGQGIHFDVDPAVYYADPTPAPSLTQSVAKILLDRSPQHAWLAHPRLNPNYQHDAEGYDAARIIGQAAHALMLGRGKKIVQMPFDNFRTKEAQDTRDKAFDGGFIPILPHHYERAEAMVTAARAQVDALGWVDAFRVGQGEAVIVAKDGPTWLRSMVDWLAAPTVAYDLKTSGACLAPHVIGRKAEADGWHIQAAMQERILDIIDPQSAGQRVFRFVAQENEPPWALVGVELDEHWLTLGRKQINAALYVWHRCMEKGEWPSYPAVPITPEYPGYRESAWLDREQSEPQFAPDLIMAG